MRAAFDADADAVRTYNSNLGPHAVVARAEGLSGADLLRLADAAPGDCALVAGGPPCQGFSVQRRGAAVDHRNDLVLEFIRLVLEIRPAMFLMENVSAIQGPRGRSFLLELTKQAARGGYGIASRVLDAADFGVPQHRRRAFLVGGSQELLARFRFPSPTHRERHRTVRDAIGDLPSPTPETSGHKPIANHAPDRISELNRLRISHVPQGGGRDDIPPDLRLKCHAVSVERAGHRNVYGRLHWDRPAGTITTKCNSFTRGKFAHPAEDRNITMREAARLQSFPDDFVFEGSKVPVAHQIGNAVPPLLAEHVGRALFRALTAAGDETEFAADQFALRL